MFFSVGNVKKNYLDFLNTLFSESSSKTKWGFIFYYYCSIKAKKYVSSFDYEAELAVFRKEEKYFNYFGPNGYRGEFGRMEAFIFRRVNNNEMTLQKISGSIDFLEKDLDGLD